MLKTSRNRTTRCGIGYTCHFGAGSNDFLTLVKGGLYDTDVSNKYIVALHNDLSIIDTYSSPDKLWPSIKIYDWEGNFIVGAKLPKGMRINQIAFDGEKNIAYFFDAEEKFYR